MSRDRRLLASLGLFLVALVALLTWMVREGPSRLAPSQGSVEKLAPEPAGVILPTVSAAPRAAGNAAEEREALRVAEAKAPAARPFWREDLYGTVFDWKTRAPISGARVQIMPADWAGQTAGRLDSPPGLKPTAVLTTDAGGCFRYEGVGAFERRDVLVLADGYAPEQAQLESGRRGEMPLTRALDVAGRVLRRSDRSPVAGVQVWFGWENYDLRHLAGKRVLTDEQGRFVLTGAPCGVSEPIPIRFAPTGSFPLTHAVILGTEPVEGLELLVADRGELRLRFVDLESGVPLGGFRGWVEDLGPFEADASGTLVIGHDTDRLEAFAGGIRVEITSDTACTTRILVPLDQLEEQHDVPISRGARIEGLVRDDKGLPIADAIVSIQIHDPYLSSPKETQRGLPPGITIISPNRRHTLTDESGAFSFDRLFVSESSGRMPKPMLRASGEGFRSVSLSTPVPAPGGKRWVEVTLEGSAAVRGHVLRNGEPLGGTHVAAYGSSQNGWCNTNDGGEYLITGLAPGTTQLKVCHDYDTNDALAEATVVLRVGETLEQDLSFQEDAGGTIEGRVVDEHGEPVAEVMVFRRESDQTMISPMGMIRGLGNDSTNSFQDGSFRLDVPAGSDPLEVVAWRRGVEASARAVPGDQDVEITLPSGGILRLLVFDPEGERVSSLEQVLWWTAGSSRETPSAGFVMGIAPSADGSFEVKLPVRRWDLELRSGNRAPALVFDADVVAESPKEIRVALLRGTTVEVRFEPGGPDSTRGLALLSAEERARREAGDFSYMMGVARSWLIPTSDGALVAHGLAPGSYGLDNLPKGWGVEPATFDVPDAEKHAVTLRWVRLEEKR